MLLPELPVSREALRHRAAGAAAGAAPRGEVGLGAGAGLALAPREALGEAEHLGVGELAHSVALEDDAAAARDLRNFFETDDQHSPVLADKGNGIAVGGDTDRGRLAL